MRVTLLTEGIWPDVIGGMQKHSYYLAKYLAGEGIQVNLYYGVKRNSKDSLSAVFTDAEKKLIQFKKVSFPSFQLRFPGHYLLSNFLFSKRLYREFVQDGNSEFVYAQGFTCWYFAGIKRNFILASNLHGLEMYQMAFGLKSKISRYLLRIPASRIIRNSDINYSLGGKLTDILKRHGAGNTHITPIGLPEEYAPLNASRKSSRLIRFLFIGRDERRKGMKELLKALESIDTETYRFEFIGILQPPLAFLNHPNIHFHGPVYDENKIKEILLNSDVLVCPSLAEGMPTVILEAMATSNAIVATDTGATSLLVDSENGLLLKPGDIEALRKAILFMIQMNRDKLNQMQQNSRVKFKEKFTWKQSIQKTISSIQISNPA